VRALRSPGFLVAIAVACVALPTAAVGAPELSAGTVATAANSVTYTDSTGEDPLAPDITTTVVSNNDAGVISFRINIPNRATLTRDILVLLFVDSDSNPATGDPDSLGADYVIQLFEGEVALFRWDGTDFTRRAGDPPSTSLIFSYQGGVTVTISAAELGNTKKFSFGSIVISGIVVDETTGGLDFTNSKSDLAPSAGSGFYVYEVKLAPTALVVKRFATTPAKPVAGKPFALRLRVARSDTGALVQGGRVTCLGRVGKSALRAKSGRFVGSEAVCAFVIPAGAKGKSFRGSVTIVFEGLRSTRSFSGRIG
jgi:hypothetical protein